jgi:hypothetical protein
MQPEFSLKWSQKPVTGTYPDLDESSPHPHILYVYDPI